VDLRVTLEVPCARAARTDGCLFSGRVYGGLVKLNSSLAKLNLFSLSIAFIVYYPDPVGEIKLAARRKLGGFKSSPPRVRSGRPACSF